MEYVDVARAKTMPGLKIVSFFDDGDPNFQRSDHAPFWAIGVDALFHGFVPFSVPAGVWCTCLTAPPRSQKYSKFEVAEFKPAKSDRQAKSLRISKVPVELSDLVRFPSISAILGISMPQMAINGDILAEFREKWPVKEQRFPVQDNCGSETFGIEAVRLRSTQRKAGRECCDENRMRTGFVSGSWLELQLGKRWRTHARVADDCCPERGSTK